MAYGLKASSCDPLMHHFAITHYWTELGQEKKNVLLPSVTNPSRKNKLRVGNAPKFLSDWVLSLTPPVFEKKMWKIHPQLWFY